MTPTTGFINDGLIAVSKLTPMTTPENQADKNRTQPSKHGANGVPHDSLGDVGDDQGY
jgi:hypothetical protein